MSSAIAIRLAKDQLFEYGKITKGRYKYYSQLYIEDDLVTKSGRVLVPASLWFQITSQVHSRNHWGYITTYNNIAKNFYWPGQRKYIKLFCFECDV